MGRLSRADRRRQLLDSALEIIRADGTNALTLVTLADRAGVSRPVVYDHFGTREGLLVELYRDYDERIGATMREALRQRARSLGAVASALSTAYVDGVVDAGEKCEEVFAALSGSPQTREVLRESREFHIEQFRQALEPFARLDLPALTGMFSAVDGLARAAADGRISRADAIATASLVVKRLASAR
ncbi:TetR family transcriptional regulator [Actinosynnema sp. ALI-1.44]|uniref:TetR/AcrR family transcriptional regulator n=1 Tax=Actinosynnema sp. ALI-1.44 TaxID=1933779 RepID=UPI00097C6368|nr:TetR/AcrR family transcriptional regulator [Actinosynnema sp. ALI-1.44]ONI81239.1 TetR family transcriptional regulator [Actinosynnema sp. ALI-1.44]